MGTIEMTQITTRFGDTVWDVPEAGTRNALMADYGVFVPVEKRDLRKLIADPQGPYLQLTLSAANRKKDDVIYRALLDAVLRKTENNGAYASVTLPASQKIVAGGTGMTKAKLIAAKAMFRRNECDEQNGEELYMTYNADMLTQILSDTTLTSADFMAVKMLQEGAVNGNWLGFKWLAYEKLDSVTADSVTTKTAAAWCKSAVHFGTGAEYNVDNGFSNTMRGYGALITRSPAYLASRAEQKKMAVGLETILHTRARTMGDLVDSSSRTTAAEAGMERITDVFGKLTMMGHFDDMNKSVNGMITSDGILSGAFPAKRLAKLGINEKMAERIQREFQKHGEVIQGWHIGNFEKWDDQYAAGLLQSAVLKDVNNTVITPGIGDTPLWASTPLGKTVFQFKSFATASYNRATLGGLQEGTAQFYYGTAFQIGLGSLTYALKQAANGREVDLTPQKMVLEGIDRSGILGPLMEYNNMAEKVSGGMIGLGPLLGTGTQSRYASRGFIGSALGPTFGLLDTVTDVTAGVLNGDAGDRVLHSVRTLLPGNNLFWIAPLINQVDPGMR
nr:phage capsid protein [Klebsiella variicola]